MREPGDHARGTTLNILGTILNVFKVKELRDKLLFTLGMLAVYVFLGTIGAFCDVAALGDPRMRRCKAILIDRQRSRTSSGHPAAAVTRRAWGGVWRVAGR